MTFRLDPLTRYETALGCLVETQRQQNAHGLEIEHVTLSGPAHDDPLSPTDDEGDHEHG